MKKILSDKETSRILRETFKCTRKTVWNALNGVYDTDLSRRIRKRALDLGMQEKGEERITNLSKRL